MPVRDTSTLLSCMVDSKLASSPFTFHDYQGQFRGRACCWRENWRRRRFRGADQESEIQELAEMLGLIPTNLLTPHGLEARTAPELLALYPLELDRVLLKFDDLLEPARAECTGGCKYDYATRCKPVTPESEGVRVSGFRPRVATCHDCPCPHNPQQYTSWTFVSSVLESLMEGLIIRPLDGFELNFICGWMYYRFVAPRAWRGDFLSQPSDVADVLDQLYFYWPDNMEDIFADRAKFGTQQPVDILVYNKDKNSYVQNRFALEPHCLCADPIAAPTGRPQILLCTAGLYPKDSIPAPYWGWIAAEDVVGSMAATGLVVVEHLLYTVHKPQRPPGALSPYERFSDLGISVCRDGKIWPLFLDHAMLRHPQRCTRCFLHMPRHMFEQRSPDNNVPVLVEVCSHCRDVCRCKRCKKERTEEGFSESMWQHRSERGAVCMECVSADMCQDCGLAVHKCDDCGECQTHSGFSEPMWHNKATQTRRTLCLECSARAGEATHRCDLCGECFTRSGFPAAMWANKSKQTQRTLCCDCCRPKCTAPTCNTCKVCRQPHRKRQNCQDPIVALEKSSLPTEVAQLQSWLCSVCKPKMCSLWPFCRKERRSKGSDSTDQYTCRDCRSL